MVTVFIGKTRTCISLLSVLHKYNTKLRFCKLSVSFPLACSYILYCLCRVCLWSNRSLFMNLSLFRRTEWRNLNHCVKNTWRSVEHSSKQPIQGDTEYPGILSVLWINTSGRLPANTCQHVPHAPCKPKHKVSF